MVAPLAIAGLGMGGSSLGGKLFGRFNKSARNLAKKQKAYEKARAKAAIQDIEAEEAFRREEDPREQALLKQSLFGRGMGKSSIAEQDTKRLLAHQARRRAALDRQKGLALRGLSLIKKQSRYAKRMMPLEIWGDVTGSAGQAAGMFLGGMGGGA